LHQEAMRLQRGWQMVLRAARVGVLSLSLLGAMALPAYAGEVHDQASFESYFHAHHEGWRGGRDFDDGGFWAHNRHVAAVPEPSEWLFMGIGLALLGAVALRRKAKLLDR